jgi:hypothetical protein
MNLFSIAKIAAGVAVSGTILAACTVVVDEGPGYRPPPSRPTPPPIACTREYMPVCAQRGGQRRTFGNACMARAEGFSILGDGECRSGPPSSGPGSDWNRPPSGPGGNWNRPPEQRACTMEYRPVCARRGSQVRTFGNACSAESEGFQIVHNGECGRPTRM